MLDREVPWDVCGVDVVPYFFENICGTRRKMRGEKGEGRKK